MLEGVYVIKIEDPNLKTDNVDPEDFNNSQRNVMAMKDIVIPKKRKRTETSTMKNTTKFQKSDKITIPIQNKFSQLTDLGDHPSDIETTDETGTGETLHKKVITQTNNDNKSAKKPPALVMHGEITDHNQLLNRTKDIVIGKFFVKYHIGFTEVFTT